MARSIRVREFDLWRAGYAGATVTVYQGGTTTKASLYSDPALTAPLANPQQLQVYQDASGNTYGRWQQPVYVGVPYQLNINSDENTGTERLPIYDMTGVDTGGALATSTRGTQARSISDRADDVIRVKDFGTLGASSVTNTTILSNAIGAAAAQGGGDVLIPAGSWPFTTLTLPARVRLRGDGSDVCTIRSLEAQAVITLGGNYSGLVGLTLDGVNLITNSIGIYSVGRTDTLFDDVVVKRFDIGWQAKGADRPICRRFYVSNCNKGCDLRGDDDAAASAAGGPFRGLLWVGGKVDLCTTVGVQLTFIDDLVYGATFQAVDFLSNVCPALKLNGARSVALLNCRWDGTNTTDLQLQDDSNLARVADNTIRHVTVRGGRFKAGQLLFNGSCEKVLFEECDFANVSFVLSIPTSPIMLLDCREDAATTSTGATSKLLRYARTGRGQVPGVTTDATWTTAWALQLNPGEVVRIRARVIGRQRDGTNTLSGEIVGTASRAAATLGFDTAVGTLAVGSIVIGNTSGASARIVANSQSGASGTLSVRDVAGTFTLGESLATSAGQTARCTAGLNTPAVTVNSGDVAKVTPNPQSDVAWDYNITGSTPQVLLQVKGDTSQIVEWLAEVDVMRP